MSCIRRLSVKIYSLGTPIAWSHKQQIKMFVWLRNIRHSAHTKISSGWWWLRSGSQWGDNNGLLEVLCLHCRMELGSTCHCTSSLSPSAPPAHFLTHRAVQTPPLSLYQQSTAVNPSIRYMFERLLSYTIQHIDIQEMQMESENSQTPWG